MAQIVTITNPLTGQPAQVDQLEHTAQQIDDGIGFESTDYPGCYYRMVDGVVEWFNPPMQVGGIDADGNPINEYRTTERYLGKPVYVKLVDFGTFPNSTIKQVEHGCTNVGVMISCIGNLGNATANNYPGVSAVFANPIYIRVDTDSDFSAFTGRFILKYTKTTD